MNRPTVHPAQVVGDLGQYDGQPPQLGRQSYGRIDSTLPHEFMLQGAEVVTRIGGEELNELPRKLFQRIHPGSHGRATLGHRQKIIGGRLKPSFRGE